MEAAAALGFSVLSRDDHPHALVLAHNAWEHDKHLHCILLPAHPSFLYQPGGLKGSAGGFGAGMCPCSMCRREKSLERCGVQRRVVAGASGIGTWVSNVFAVCGTAIAEDDHQLCHVRQALAWCHLSVMRGTSINLQG